MSDDFFWSNPFAPGVPAGFEIGSVPDDRVEGWRFGFMGGPRAIEKAIRSAYRPVGFMDLLKPPPKNPPVFTWAGAPWKPAEPAEPTVTWSYATHFVDRATGETLWIIPGDRRRARR